MHNPKLPNIQTVLLPTVFPPPYLIVGGPVWYWFPLLLPNIHLPIWPNPIDFCLISPQHLLPVLYSLIPWYWENFRHCWWWDPLSIGTFFFVTDLKPASFNTFLTVWGVTELDMVEFMNWVAWIALSSFPELIWQIIDCLLWGESLEGQPPGWFSLSPSTSLLILPIVPFPRPILAWIWQWEYPSLRRETTEECFSVEMDFIVVVRR